MSMTNRSIRCMSFNIRYDNEEDGPNSWNFRKDLASDMLRFHQVHIAGMQEVLHHQLQDLEARLPEYAWIGTGREDGSTRGEYAPVFYLKEYYSPTRSGVFWLSEQPNTPGSLGWDAACIRIATWAEFNVVKTGQRLFFINTHFDHVGAVAMRNSAILLKNRICELAGKNPILLTGDFNNTADSEVYRILTDSCNDIRLQDARNKSLHRHHGPNITYHEFEADQYLLYHSKTRADETKELDTSKFECIDFIFASDGVDVIEHGTLCDCQEGLYPSDHFPIIADVVLRG